MSLGWNHKHKHDPFKCTHRILICIVASVSAAAHFMEGKGSVRGRASCKRQLKCQWAECVAVMPGLRGHCAPLACFNVAQTQLCRLGRGDQALLWIHICMWWWSNSGLNKNCDQRCFIWPAFFPFFLGGLVLVKYFNIWNIYRERYRYIRLNYFDEFLCIVTSDLCFI